MEVTGAVLRRSPAAAYASGRARRRLVAPARVCVGGGGGGGGFADEGHLRYYEAAPSVRKARKAVEAVAKLRAMGLIAGDDAKAKVISEAAEMLLTELNQMMDQEEEMKRRRKEEKAAMKALKKKQHKEEKKAAAMNGCNEEDSSSSESSDSECEEKDVVKMSCVATVAGPQIAAPIASDICTDPVIGCDKAAMKAMKKKEKKEKKAAMKMKEKEEKKAAAMRCCKDEDSSSCSSESSDSECGEEEVVKMSRCTTVATPQSPSSRSTVFPIIVPQIPASVAPEPCKDAQITAEPAMQCSSVIAVAEKPMNRIEVCMGGKCKKSGSPELLQEFAKKVGIEGAVVGCKCMGKCREGPNVRVQRNQNSEESCVSKNPVCIGVGLDDVGTIVAGFFGDDLRLMAA